MCGMIQYWLYDDNIKHILSFQQNFNLNKISIPTSNMFGAVPLWIYYTIIHFHFFFFLTILNSIFHLEYVHYEK